MLITIRSLFVDKYQLFDVSKLQETTVRKEATALSRAKVLRPILEIEEQGFPVSCALEDAAHDLGLSKSHTWRLYRRMKANDARSERA